MTFADVVARVEAAFRGELPGAAAQDLMAPAPRRQWPAGVNAARVRDAAGLLLLFPSTADDSPGHVVLTLRSDGLRRHGGQVSLPGGVVEPGETFEQAALREAHEEVALSPHAVKILGALTPLDIPVSGFRLHPIVGATHVRPVLAAVDTEVARILEIPINALLDPIHLIRTARDRDGVSVSVPAFDVAGHQIWGATAMVLAEFLALLGWSGRNAT